MAAEASMAAREVPATGTCEHVTHDPHHHHHQIAAAFHNISRPSHTISAIISPPPPLHHHHHHASVILDDDPFHVPRIILPGDNYQVNNNNPRN